MINTSGHEVQENYTEAGGFTTRYLECGDTQAPPVLLLHDGAWGGASSVTWNHVIPALAQSYRVIAPDLLGFGGTDKAVFLDRSPYEPRINHLAAFVAKLGVSGGLHVIGNSFGGSLALRMLASGTTMPFHSITSINGTGGPWRTPKALSELGHWDGTEQDLRRIIDLLIDNTPLMKGQVQERLKWATTPGHYRAVSAAALPLPQSLVTKRPADDWPAQLQGNQTPMLLVSGKRDVLLDPDWTSHLQGVMPHAEVESLDCKHEPNIDHPEVLLPVLLNFLAKVDDKAETMSTIAGPE